MEIATISAWLSCGYFVGLISYWITPQKERYLFEWVVAPGVGLVAGFFGGYFGSLFGVTAFSGSWKLGSILVAFLFSLMAVIVYRFFLKKQYQLG